MGFDLMLHSSKDEFSAAKPIHARSGVGGDGRK
jgi:hypothetical protein